MVHPHSCTVLTALAKSLAGLPMAPLLALLTLCFAFAAKSAAGLLGTLPLTFFAAFCALAANWDGSGMPSTAPFTCQQNSQAVQQQHSLPESTELAGRLPERQVYGTVRAAG